MKHAQLLREQVETHLEQVRTKLAKEFGVTVTEDTSGAWGPIGARYVTLRHNDMEVFMLIQNISSWKADKALRDSETNPS